MPKTLTIPAAPEGAPEVQPPCGGSWLRLADGGLQPADADTAARAGLLQPNAQPDPAQE